jgi:hypothetical protein
LVAAALAFLSSASNLLTLLFVAVTALLAVANVLLASFNLN